jgi:ABC-type molybdate transport system permease subunit
MIVQVLHHLRYAYSSFQGQGPASNFILLPLPLPPVYLGLQLYSTMPGLRIGILSVKKLGEHGENNNF